MSTSSVPICTAAYKLLLQEAKQLFDELLALYLPDERTKQDFATCTIIDIEVKRNGIVERLASTEPVTTALTATLIQSIGRYLDGHWDDYREIPVPNPTKYTIREQLHHELEKILHQIGQLHDQLDKLVSN